ncbi:hypothetical protein T484DRAFT_1784442 [Baffinella frigidus]|nr:hypothetical protein T484DRAFT_1784442 [Cryptophyta sp. CCMP2293]
MKAFLAEQRKKAKEARGSEPIPALPEGREAPSRALPPLQLNERVQSVSKGPGAKFNHQAVIGRIAQLATESDSRWGVVWEELDAAGGASALLDGVSLTESGKIEENGVVAKVSMVERSDVVPLCSLEDALRGKFSDGAVQENEPITRALTIQLLSSGISTIRVDPRMCPSLTELDISLNCVASFADLAWLIGSLPTLRSLNASGNPLSADAALSLAAARAASDAPRGAALETLVLNNIAGFTWEALTLLLAATEMI